MLCYNECRSETMGLTTKQKNNIFNQELWGEMFTITEISTYETIYLFSQIDFESKELLKRLKEELNGKEKMIFITSDPNDYKKIDRETKELIKYFKKMKIKEFNVIDYRATKYATIKHIENADIILFMSGIPLTQMNFIKEYEIDELINGFKGVLIGISAGAMNMAFEVYWLKDEKRSHPKTKVYNGLGLTDVVIDPHFDISDEARIKDFLKPKIEITGLPDESYIKIDKYGVKTTYGDSFIKNKKTVEKISDNHLK